MAILICGMPKYKLKFFRIGSQDRREVRLNNLLRKLMSYLVLASLLTGAFPVMNNRTTGTLHAQAISDSQVKAAFLYNFAKFIDWPADAFSSDSSPIVIGVVGNDPFGGALEQTTSGRSVNGRPIAIKRLRLGQDLRDCHILFVSVSEKRQLTAVMLSVKQASVLTVGDMDEFIDEGGVIRFLLEGDRVRFEINLAAAERARLKISSKLLSLAKSVKKR
ncbi:MAG TPA: YfiR family protein [Blastocatellia bacterium]|nr:YfiR family protein [Blastocatellia bacterium]